MRFFAKVETDNVVSQVVQFEDDFDNPVQFLVEQAKKPGLWLETWEDGKARKHFACAGSTYDPALDVFIFAKVADNFVFDSKKLEWVAPTPSPGKDFYWSLEDSDWVKIDYLDES
jgi:hypothetical protein